ncbi:hypothetical protein [Rubinisphaera margarita]|uniref:hypothetical protein n=1 Tax=Rubinisphaera margarita TaxID=2909586 RepID=UPI001EE8C7D1|nr:hypothetical protein [Rubinisphaera margarita]MCG6156605.1 hypothetical protein [Rubinisphaera margarita]
MDYEDDDWDDDLDYGDNHYDNDDETDTADCPECGAAVYEDADACPACGCYLHHGWQAGGYYPWYTFGGRLKEWSPFWLFLAMTGVIVTIFTLMTL